MRICSLLPSATEIVCQLGLGDQLVAVTHECDYPPQILGLPFNPEDATRVKEKTSAPQNARDEKVMRRKAAKEAAQVREYYEEMVLNKKSKKDLVQLGVN